jgi:hypothetical protein
VAHGTSADHRHAHNHIERRKHSRERKKEATGKLNDERRSLRKISEELAAMGFLNERELKLARSNATPEQEPRDFGVFGERQLDVYRLLSKLVKGSGTKPGGDLMPLLMGVYCLGGTPRR